VVDLLWYDRQWRRRLPEARATETARRRLMARAMEGRRRRDALDAIRLVLGGYRQAPGAQ
jgi:siroheme synthase (precorrin-2 oxidase/ferrochelatase)